MKCLHCNIAIHDNIKAATLTQEDEYPLPNGAISPSGTWREFFQRCPECGELMIWLERSSSDLNGRVARFRVYPQGNSRPIPAEVTKPYREDFHEACLVLMASPKASAALSRRCMQAILKDKAGAKKKDLFDQIEEVIASNTLPTHIVDELHAVRSIGNFAAHPRQSSTRS
jgi:hypothetical protein